MIALTTAEKHASKLLVRPLIDAMGRNHTVATVSRASGVSKQTLSRWICGDANLVPKDQDKIRAFIDNPTEATPKWKDSDRYGVKSSVGPVTSCGDVGG